MGLFDSCFDTALLRQFPRRYSLDFGNFETVTLAQHFVGQGQFDEMFG
jgi:hypothetical protein